MTVDGRGSVVDLMVRILAAGIRRSPERRALCNGRRVEGGSCVPQDSGGHADRRSGGEGSIAARDRSAKEAIKTITASAPVARRPRSAHCHR